MILFQLSALAAVAFLFGVVQLSDADEACSYAACVFRGIEKRSSIDYYFLLLNINKISLTDIKDRCLLVQQKYQECSPEYVGCPLEVTLAHSDRLDDPVYMHFLITEGKKICDNLDKYLKLIPCFTDDLQTALQKYVNDNGYDVPSLRNTFLELNHCSDEENEIFIDLLDNGLVNNPYIKKNQPA